MNYEQELVAEDSMRLMSITADNIKNFIQNDDFPGLVAELDWLIGEVHEISMQANNVED